MSVREELDAIRSILGVCPQHDVLWDDLTAIEHMKLFGYLKDIPSQEMENEIATLLKEVQLDKVNNSTIVSVFSKKKISTISHNFILFLQKNICNRFYQWYSLTFIFTISIMHIPAVNLLSLSL